MTVRGTDTCPKAVYVLVRVSNMYSAIPSHTVYVDPHRWLCDGGMRIVSDLDVMFAD